MGLSLSAIRNILEAPRTGAGEALLERLLEIDLQVLHGQQRFIRTLLGQLPLPSMGEGLTREKWNTLLRSAGMSHADRLQRHREFERLFPHDHQAFLESLSLDDDDIDVIRNMSRQGI
jgi:hypothetical protein